MSSEAAQKAYPKDEWSAGANWIARDAFDVGAVHALRQAAEKITLVRMRKSPEEADSIFVVMDYATEVARATLGAMADDWEREVRQCAIDAD